MNTQDLARRLLADRDPFPPDRPLDPADLRRATALPSRILAESRTVPGLRQPRAATAAPVSGPVAGGRWPVLAGATVIVILVLGAGVWGTGLLRSSPAYATTPRPLSPVEPPVGPAAPVLERAAASAAALPPLPDSSHAYLRTASWYLHTAVSGGRASSQIVPRITETWIGPDGAVTVATSTGAAQEADGPGSGPDAAALAALPDHGDAEIVRYTPGEYGTGPAELPSDPAALRASLLGNEQVPDAPELLDAVAGILRSRPLTPPELSTLWAALALQPDLVSYGEVVDRAGRIGTAIGIETAASGLPIRELLLLDPSTGRPLGAEEVLTIDPGALNVRVPAVIGYEVHLAADRVTAAAVPAP